MRVNARFEGVAEQQVASSVVERGRALDRGQPWATPTAVIAPALRVTR